MKNLKTTRTIITVFAIIAMVLALVTLVNGTYSGALCISVCAILLIILRVVCSGKIAKAEKEESAVQEDVSDTEK